MVLQGFTSEEVRLHNTKDDLWIIIEDKVYDLSKWKQKHPGGAAILLDFAGTDATGNSPFFPSSRFSFCNL
jgi:cytochrome-b5 reductase